jgi:hypothetical protein
MHQGWTKFASHLWYGTNDGGVAALAYSPSVLTTKIGNQNEVTIKEITNYPFEESVTFEIATKLAASFPLHLRIPSWCKEATLTLNGKALQTGNGGTIVVVNRQWSDKDKLVLTMPMEVTTSNWAKNSRSIERGPLVYALKLGERWEKGTHEKEGDYFSVYSTEEWNYGLIESIVKDPKANLKVTTRPMPANFVWNQKVAPIEITATAKKIPDWKVVNGVAHQPVTDRTGVYKGTVEPEVHSIKLIPYGFTKVRVVAFPVVR